jgi:3-dehydroquinate dehydratase/shikimate dehydrogenase
MTAHSPLNSRRSDATLDGERPLSVVASIAGPPATAAAPLEQLRELERLPAGIRCVEVRADLTGDIDPRPLRDHAPGGVLYTLRSAAEGGGCGDPPDRRRARLVAAADHYDFVELEAGRDLHRTILDRIPPHRRVLSWYGPAADLAGLRRRFAAMAAVPARLYRLAPAADTMAQALVPLRLLKSLGRDDVTAYARGPMAAWTRVLTARFGAPIAFARLPGSTTDPSYLDQHAQTEGELPLRRLLADYPHQLLTRADRLYGIIGAATAKSLCPFAHNSAYRALGIPALFLPFSTSELARSLEELHAGLEELALPLRAMAVVAPHKDAAFQLTAEATPFARRVGAASLLIRAPSGWWGDTEAAGIVATMTGRQVEVARRRIAVVGCGGAGRAAAAGLSQAGAQVTLINRSIPAGRRAAERLGLPFVPLREFDPHSYNVLINATPVRDTTPFPIEGLDPATVIFDLCYGATETPLVAAARTRGHITIDGSEMTLVQLPLQFHRMTGHHIPIGIVRDAQHEFSGNATDPESAERRLANSQ